MLNWFPQGVNPKYHLLCSFYFYLGLSTTSGRAITRAHFPGGMWRSHGLWESS